MMYTGQVGTVGGLEICHVFVDSIVFTIEGGGVRGRLSFKKSNNKET